MVDWNCPVCGQPNAADARRCVQCSCPAEASAEDILSLRTQYTGPVFDSPAPELDDGPPPPRLFSHAWWDVPVDHLQACLLVAAVGAGSGALAAILGAVGTARHLQAWGVAAGAVVMAVTAVIGYARFYLLAFDRRAKGTRRDVVLYAAILETAVLGLLMVPQGR